MGCASSTPNPEVFEYVFPVDPKIPVLGAKQGVKIHETLQFELVMYKKMFDWGGGNSYAVTYRPANKPFYNVAVKGKEGRHSRDQMDFIHAQTKEPIAVCMRNGPEWLPIDRFKIYTPVPLYEGQSPVFHYKMAGGSAKIPMYVYAKVREHQDNSGIVLVTMDNQAEGEKPIYQCRSEISGLFKRYIYKQGRQCAYLREGTNRSILVQLNPGIDPVLILCLTAILDEMD